MKNVEDFESEVIESKLPVILYFTAAWCGPCKVFSPVLDQISEHPAFAGKVHFAKLDVDEHTDLAQELKILSIPTLMLYHCGRFSKVMTGFAGNTATEEKIKAALYMADELAALEAGRDAYPKLFPEG
jgi:thioredoxin 1